MLGHGALGEFALGDFGSKTLARSSEILEKVITGLVGQRKLSELPASLHHFTTLDTAHQIISSDNIRLSHAEYSNDQTELDRAKTIIRQELGRRTDPFVEQVLGAYESLAPTMDAFVFCMSSGGEALTPQDILSQWRAYGQDGRGVCLTLDAHGLSRIVQNVPGLRINPIVYDEATQVQLVNEIIEQGLGQDHSQVPNAGKATVAALVFVTPLIKAAGFAEEREWRLVFMPSQEGPKPNYGFQPRREFLAPFLNLNEIWTDLRPELLAIHELRATLPTHLPAVSYPPLVPVTDLMIGPSGHQQLNVRAFTKLLSQANRTSLKLLQSSIPYRSLS